MCFGDDVEIVTVRVKSLNVLQPSEMYMYPAERYLFLDSFFAFQYIATSF